MVSYTQRVKNFLEIAPSLMVFEINNIFNFRKTFLDDSRNSRNLTFDRHYILGLLYPHAEKFD